MTEENKSLVTLNVTEIMNMIPHRYPFLLVDKVIDLVVEESITAIKNVTFNEPYFVGHFPGHPVMPGVLIVEAMAQTAAILASKTMNADTDKISVYFMSIDEAKFRQIVSPGDTLRIVAKLERRRNTVWKFKAEAFVEGKLVSEAKLTAMVKEGASNE